MNCKKYLLTISTDTTNGTAIYKHWLHLETSGSRKMNATGPYTPLAQLINPTVNLATTLSSDSKHLQTNDTTY
jgi:hypothetical protein